MICAMLYLCSRFRFHVKNFSCNSSNRYILTGCSQNYSCVDCFLSSKLFMHCDKCITELCYMQKCKCTLLYNDYLRQLKMYHNQRPFCFRCEFSKYQQSFHRHSYHTYNPRFIRCNHHIFVRKNLSIYLSIKDVSGTHKVPQFLGFHHKPKEFEVDFILTKF